MRINLWSTFWKSLRYRLLVIDYRLAKVEPKDLMGLPEIRGGRVVL